MCGVKINECYIVILFDTILILLMFRDGYLSVSVGLLC